MIRHRIPQYLRISVVSLLLTAAAFAQKTVTGNIKDLAGNVNQQVAMKAAVQNCGTNIVRGGGILDGPPDGTILLNASGDFSVTLQDETTLACGSTTASAFYRFSIIRRDPITGKQLNVIAYNDYDITGTGTVALKDLTPRNAPAPAAVANALLTNASGDQTVVIPGGHTIRFTGGTLDLTATTCLGCGTGGGGSGAAFVDNETPSGAINGSNAAFTLAQSPNPAASLFMVRNGVVLLAGGVDYTLTGSAVAFASGAIPQTGDTLRAWYRTSNGTLNLVDFETPSGAIDGINATFTLTHTPSPAADLVLMRNGVISIAGGADYSLSGSTITFISGAIPQAGDALRASYRY
jgi:hypothetical protein